MRAISCAEAARYVYAYIDGEIEPSTEAELLAHVRACRKCLGVIEFERRILDFVQRHAEVVECPKSLRERVERLLGEA